MGWLSGWAKRIKLTLDSSQVDAALTDFPVPVYLSAASGIGDVDVSCVFTELGSDANRKKIAVTTSDGTTQCYVEIERWDHASTKAWLHTKAPSLANDVDPELYLYYDSTHADNTTHVGDTGDAAAQAVWDSNFKAVYHMGQDPSGGADAVKDSTSNANHLTSSGTMTSADLVDSQFGKGIDFDGSDDALSAPYDPTLNILNAITIETVANRDVITSRQYLFTRGDGPNNTDSEKTYEFTYGDVLRFRRQGADQVYGTTTVDTSAHHVAVTFDKDGAGQRALLYLDGVDDTDLGSSANPSGAMASNSEGVMTGRNPVDSSEIYSPFDGVISGLRLSNIARSAAWVKATYHGLFDSLITFGTEETPAEAVEVPANMMTILDAAPSIPPWAISGTVKEGGSPIARTVRAYKRSDGSFIAGTTSDGGDGSFSFSDLPAEPVYVVALDDESGEAYNALIFDRVLPKQVPN